MIRLFYIRHHLKECAYWVRAHSSEIAAKKFKRIIGSWIFDRCGNCGEHIYILYASADWVPEGIEAYAKPLPARRLKV